MYVYLYYKSQLLYVCLSVCPLLSKLKWNVESKFVFANVCISLYMVIRKVNKFHKT